MLVATVWEGSCAEYTNCGNGFVNHLYGVSLIW